MSLPSGYTSRPMLLADAAIIAEQSALYTSALLGFPKHSPEDVANYLRDPAVNLATDGWVVHDPDGEFAGSATAVTTPTHVNVDILSEHPAVLNWLLAQAEHRASDATPGPTDSTAPAASAHPTGSPPSASPAGGAGVVVVRVGVIRQDQLLPEVLTARGFVVGTSVQRMRISFDGPVSAPPVPEGVVVRRGAPDEATKRAAHGVLMEAFKEQPGALPRPFEEWVESRESRSTFDWS